MQANIGHKILSGFFIWNRKDESITLSKIVNLYKVQICIAVTELLTILTQNSCFNGLIEAFYE